MKRKYYVNIADGSITEKSTDNHANFAFYANKGDLAQLKEKFEAMDTANKGSFWRAHIPYYPPHATPENAMYDANLKQVYHLLHTLGDEETKQHIESIGILEEPGDHLV